MAGRPSIVPDYVSIILRAIETTQNDPARLRSLVYDVARLSLGKHVLTAYHQLGSATIQQHVFDLETAIHKVEDLAQEQIAHSSQQADPTSDDLVIQLSQDRIIEPDHRAIVVRDSFGGEMFDEMWSDRTSALVPSGATEVCDKEQQIAELLPPLKVWEPAFGRSPKRTQDDIWWGVQLICATLIGVAIYVGTLVGSDYAASRFSVVEQTASAASPPSASPTPSAKPLGGNSAQALGFPLPSVYGVYAVNEGKLYALDPLQLKVPDPRVAISAMFSNVSRVTLQDGKLQFIVFRRDLVSSAPTEMFVRVVARVARETKFSGAGPATTTTIDGQWAVRSQSYEFRVAPLGDSPEMIVLQPADPQLSLSPGRYALVVAGRGYDFAVDGEVTDAAQCLERAGVVGGAVYSECRTLPAQFTN